MVLTSLTLEILDRHLCHSKRTKIAFYLITVGEMEDTAKLHDKLTSLLLQHGLECHPFKVKFSFFYFLQHEELNYFILRLTGIMNMLNPVSNLTSTATR